MVNLIYQATEPGKIVKRPTGDTSKHHTPYSPGKEVFHLTIVLQCPLFRSVVFVFIIFVFLWPSLNF